MTVIEWIILAVVILVITILTVIVIKVVLSDYIDGMFSKGGYHSWKIKVQDMPSYEYNEWITFNRFKIKSILRKYKKLNKETAYIIRFCNGPDNVDNIGTDDLVIFPLKEYNKYNKPKKHTIKRKPTENGGEKL